MVLEPQICLVTAIRCSDNSRGSLFVSLDASNFIARRSRAVAISTVGHTMATTNNGSWAIETNAHSGYLDCLARGSRRRWHPAKSLRHSPSEEEKRQGDRHQRVAEHPIEICGDCTEAGSTDHDVSGCIEGMGERKGVSGGLEHATYRF